LFFDFGNPAANIGRAEKTVSAFALRIFNIAAAEPDRDSSRRDLVPERLRSCLESAAPVT